MDTSADASFFKIGEAFENFIQNKIFPPESYDLIHRSSTYEQNRQRFAEDSLKPDFQFRCKKSNKLFYVEAKYRGSTIAGDKIAVFKHGQRERYLENHTAECPLFIAVGFKGYPDNPQILSLFRVDEVYYPDLFLGILRKHEIKKGPYNNDELIARINQPILTREETKKAEQAIPSAQTITTISNTKRSWIAIIILVVVLIGAYLYNKKSSFDSGNAATQNVVTAIPSNANTLNSRNKDESSVSKLNNFLVRYWFGTFKDSSLAIHIRAIAPDYSFTGSCEIGDNKKEINGIIIKENTNYTLTFTDEGEDGGIFRLKYIEGDIVLVGTWAANDGSKKLDLTLTK